MAITLKYRPCPRSTIAQWNSTVTNRVGASSINFRPITHPSFSIPEPINIFNSEQKNNGYEPLRLSYQRSSHYNAILDPYKASVGVGLGLAGYKPDNLDLKQVQQAVRVSEELEIEQTMFEDKLKTTDWDATNEAIEEQIARESYLQWCREDMQRTKKSVSSTVTSQSMPGSSSTGTSAATAISTSTSAVGGGDLNATNAITAATLISCEGAAGRMSPKQQQQYQSDDGIKSNSCTSSTSTTSSSSSGSTGVPGSPSADGKRQRRRRRRHNQLNACNPAERGCDLPRAVPPEFGGLNLVETRSTDSNDSDVSEETLSKRMKRRLGEEEDQTHGQARDEAAVNERIEPEPTNRESGSSAEFTEPGPSKSGQEDKSVKEPVNFYHSLLESSYMDDGN